MASPAAGFRVASPRRMAGAPGGRRLRWQPPRSAGPRQEEETGRTGRIDAWVAARVEDALWRGVRHVRVAADQPETPRVLGSLVVALSRAGVVTIRPGQAGGRWNAGALGHRHAALILVDAADRAACPVWLIRLARISPRAHVVIDAAPDDGWCAGGVTPVRATAGWPARAWQQAVVRAGTRRIGALVRRAEFDRVEVRLDAIGISAALWRRPVATTVRVQAVRLRLWQGRFEQARRIADGLPEARRTVWLQAMVAWACGDRVAMRERAVRLSQMTSRPDRSVRCLSASALSASLTGDVASVTDCVGRLDARRGRRPGPCARMGRLVAAEACLAVGLSDRARWALAGMPAPGAATGTEELIGQRLHSRLSGDRSAEALVGRTAARLGAPGVMRWGLGRRVMYLLHAIPAVLELVNEAEDEAAALEAACRWARDHARAEVAMFLAGADGRVVVAAGRACRMTGDDRRRAACVTQPARFDQPGLAVAAAPVRYLGVALGSVVLQGEPPNGETLAEAAGALAALAGPVLRARLDVMAARESGAGLADQMLGCSPAMAALRDAVARAAVTPFPVLIEGESGTGKELAARALHRLSPRRSRTFAALNCAALADELAEAELFGHARGAFTGAVAPRAGLFEGAHGGTIFLDEVGDLSPRTQARLLRALQEREIRRLGENAPRAVDVRVVAATNRPLSELAAAGRFRDDLLFRLAVVRLRLPPLRERAEDIAVLARAFWRRLAPDVSSRAVLGADALARLACHTWPGNVRELQNVMAGLAVLAPRRGRLGVRHVDQVLAESGAARRAPPVSLVHARTSCERRTVTAALARHGGRRAAAARELGLTRQGLTKAMRRLCVLATGAETKGVA